MDLHTGYGIFCMFSGMYSVNIEWNAYTFEAERLSNEDKFVIALYLLHTKEIVEKDRKKNSRMKRPAFERNIIKCVCLLSEIYQSYGECLSETKKRLFWFEILKLMKIGIWYIKYWT